MGRLSGPATSAWTNSSPWSMAACSASWQTRSFTDLESIVYRAEIANYRPKEKVGENPPDNASEDPSKMGDYTRRIAGKQARVRSYIERVCGSSFNRIAWP